MLYALRTLKVDGGIRYPGEAVPEGYDWTNLRSYLLGGELEEAVEPSITPPGRLQDDEPIAQSAERSASREEAGPVPNADPPAPVQPVTSQNHLQGRRRRRR